MVHLRVRPDRRQCPRRPGHILGFNILAGTLSEDTLFTLVLIHNLGFDMAIALVTMLES